MFRGCYTALVTPMHANGEIDFDALTVLVDKQLDANIHGLVVNGTTGEVPTLSLDEKMKVLSVVVKRVDGRVPVIAGTGSYSTAQTVELTKAAMDAGADAALIVTPYYNKPTQEGLYQHYTFITEALPIPVVIYNIPGRTCCEMSLETLVRLSSIPNIVAIKQSALTASGAQDFIDRCGNKIDLLTGDDVEAYPMIRLGFKGVISVASNIAPKMMVQLCESALAGDHQQANELNRRLMPLYQKLFVETNPIPVKWAMHQMGLIPSGIRLPLTTLSEQFQSDVKQAIAGVE